MKTGDISLASPVHVLVVCIEIMLISYSIGDKTRFCPTTITQTFSTNCTSCAINMFVDCPVGHLKTTSGEGTPGCSYEQSMGLGDYITRKGCLHMCTTTVAIDYCCEGYWGPNCDECPGGAVSPCHGHGSCDQNITGTGICMCEEGFDGSYCDLCKNSSTYGPNCTSVCQCDQGCCVNTIDSNGCVCYPGYTGKLCDTRIDFPECANVTCPNDTFCVFTDNTTTCVSVVSNSSVSSMSNCTEFDACKELPLCSANATCISNTSSILGKMCQCLPGFQGDGFQCYPTDPCDYNNGGCPKSSTQCLLTGSGEKTCECLEGYHEYVADLGCSLIDVCKINTTACHKYATCKTIAPLQVKCTCPDGYLGDGQNCYGNIVNTIKDLHNDDPEFRGQLGFSMQVIEKYYNTELSQHGPFTIFVPSDGGFRTLNTAKFQEWLGDKVGVQQALRQHILVGEFPVEKMLNTTQFYTLQGYGAELQVRRSGYLKYRLLGASRKSRILRQDIPTTNGIIHITNTFLVNLPEAQGNAQVLMSEVLSVNGQFNRLRSLISAAGDEIRRLVDQEQVTMFAPTNSAMDNLPVGSVDFLLSDQGKEKSIVFLKNHLVNRTIEIAELINMKSVTSLANTVIPVSITEWGRVQLNGEVNITHADVVARNGLLLEVDSVLLTDGMSTLPNRCDVNETSVVQGPCGDCRDETVCFKPDIPTDLETVCTYYVAGETGSSRQGCARLCNRTLPATPKCCDGFFGKECLPCPGGHENPCSGRGTCDEGIDGEGICQCNENFTGPGCEQCDKPNFFGPNCSQECTCLYGLCNSGPAGDGKCHPFTCNYRYVGENCETQLTKCGTWADFTNCHAYAICVVYSTDNGDEYRCVCDQNYTGDGLTCKPVNPCKLPDRGGCHTQATCKMLGPGQSSCTCNSGWSGDGQYCYPGLTCAHTNDCHEEATCEETIPGEHICKCKFGYHGNGTQCLKTDMCEDNNGGCDLKNGICKATAPGKVNCTCNWLNGFYGNGVHCYGNLLTQIMNHPDLKWLTSLVTKAPDYEKELLSNYNYTIFAPNDACMMRFMAETNNTYWQTFENIATLLNYHTVFNSSSIDALVALDSVYNSYDTLADGFSLHVFRDGETVKVSARRNASIQAVVVQADIIAINGYLHIIDQVLEPYLPPPDDEKPDLETFFNNNTEYSIFGDWLKEKGLVDYIENNLTDYTLFVPNNEAMLHINRTVTKNYLRFYLVPKVKVTAAADSYERLITDLGRDYQLQYNVYSNNDVYINYVKIVHPDILTLGGIVNGIDGLLHPVLHRCKETVEDVTYSPCEPCGTRSCPTGYSSKPEQDTVLPCTYPSINQYGYQTYRDGCKGICVGTAEIDGCCDGYFGSECQECPSGPEMPCSGNGKCLDGIQGTGECQCGEHSFGDECELCQPGWIGIHCDVDMQSCDYLNGNCSINARCIQSVEGNISCTCNPGYRGDGKTCIGPCDIKNGGCHGNASCTYQVAQGVTCTCRQGFAGDGTTTCNGNIYNTLKTLPKVSLFLKSIQTARQDNGVSMVTRLSKQTFTVFAPVDSGLHNKLMPLQDIRQQLVPISISGAVKLDGTSPGQQKIYTLAGSRLILKFDKDTKSFYVNDSKVVSSNIPCGNGVIHLVDQPFTFQPLSSASPDKDSTGFPVAAIVVPVVLLLAVVAVVIGLYVYRKSTVGYWDLLQKWRSSRQDPDASSSSAPLHQRDNEQPEYEFDQHVEFPKANFNFGNPLYNVEDHQ